MYYKGILYSNSKQATFYFMWIFLLMFFSIATHHFLKSPHLNKAEHISQLDVDVLDNEAAIEDIPQHIVEQDNRDDITYKKMDSGPIKNWVLSEGETLGFVLETIGLNADDAHNIIESFTKYFNPKRLKIGHSFDFTYDDNNNFRSLKIRTTPIQVVETIRTDNGLFESYITTTPLRHYIARLSGTIDNSFISTARKLNIPHETIINITTAYSYDVDFQRDIKSGNSLDVLIDKYYTEEGKFSHNGNVIYSKLILADKEVEIYRHTDSDGDEKFFNGEALSVQKNLLRTPVNAARISSGFGMRKHPILGFSKMHKGIDFAAPVGTPILSAGNGIVEAIGWKGSYGKYLRIRHNNIYSTAYAHISRFSNGIVQGAKIKQGQVIAYVGATGRASGPHLHFEVMKYGQQINPKNVKQSADIKLTGKDLQKFKSNKIRIDKILAKLEKNNEIPAT